MNVEKKLKSEPWVADFLGISLSALRKARQHGYREGHLAPPPYLKFGRSIRYDVDSKEFRQWLSEHLQTGVIPL